MTEFFGANNLSEILPFGGVAFFIGIAFVLWFGVARGKTFMMFFQQEEYDNQRFVRWLADNKAYDQKATLLLGIAILIGALGHLDALAGLSLLLQPLILLALIFGIFTSSRTIRNSKKPLVVTARVKRIFAVYMGLFIAALGFASIITALAPKGSSYRLDIASDSASSFFDISISGYNWEAVFAAVLLILAIQAVPYLIIAANILLAPIEERIKLGYRREAEEKFNALKPKVIAITGSFGKTSTKHILSHILSYSAPTLATPGSINTEMGITRVIREMLKPNHIYFIVEMGAYGIGSIARLCTLTPPVTGLITAIGAAHFERFKSLENVARAKFELAEAVFNSGGTIVVNKDAVEPKLLQNRMQKTVGDYMLVGHGPDDMAAIQISDYQMTQDGLTIHISAGDENITLQAPLYGDHQAGNIVLAAASARALGMPWSAIKGALRSVAQIPHRLAVTKPANGPVIINDAYNSNPVGFEAALKCLDVLVQSGGRRILITPGMVELGEKHDREHARLGAMSVKHADIILVVSPDRIPTFTDAINHNNDGSVSVMNFAAQVSAENWARQNATNQDVILFENNLPDLFEAKIRF